MLRRTHLWPTRTYAGDKSVFEFGCGTGRLAEHTLRALPRTVTYLGVDTSPVMVDLATNRLAAWPDRAKTALIDGSLPLPADDASSDPVFSTYVFDLFEPGYAREVLHDLSDVVVTTPSRAVRDGITSRLARSDGRPE